MFSRAFFHIGSLGVYLASALLLVSCGTQTPSGTDAILDQVNLDLNTGNCSAALTTISPLYNSANTNNTVRTAMASVYGCFSGINFFQFISNFASAHVTSSPSALWEYLATQYPSTDPSINPSDKKVESAGFGMDADMAILSPGQVLIPGDLFNTSTYNEGSLLDTDRTADANLYLFFLATSSLGASENRAGANTNGTPTDAALPLPWVTSSTAGMSTEGCEFASAMVNLADSISTLPTTGNLGSTVNSLNTYFEGLSFGSFTLGVDLPELIYAACNYGCQNSVPASPLTPGATGETAALNTNGAWSAIACGSNTGTCANCPTLLRNRNNCAGTTNDQVSCAAAGIINMMNQSIVGWH